eukprot:TRINITY_DN8758_c0_g1_i2.p2 TRINITY_DN8758_c0_g1~~TRINITY_DN8758_c0_g1_i2.p2  ORF type:complete len:135 (+),score=30.15 TRINITY_DN8758_c0_g1_i2:635-1039(+)
MLYLCDPVKTIAGEHKNEKLDSPDKLGVAGMIKSGNYRDLIRLLLIDEETKKEFDKYLEETGIKFDKHPSFMSKEEKLAEIKAIVAEAEELKKLKQESIVLPKETKEVKKETDPNDIEYCVEVMKVLSLDIVII